MSSEFESLFREFQKCLEQYKELDQRQRRDHRELLKDVFGPLARLDLLVDTCRTLERRIARLEDLHIRESRAENTSTQSRRKAALPAKTAQIPPPASR